MEKFPEQFKFVIYCMGLGIALIVYAHANFSTVKQVDKLEDKMALTSSKGDIARLEGKIDIILSYLLEKNK